MADLVYDKPLKFGIFHGPHHATNLDPSYAYQRDLMLMEHLDRLGYDEAWIGEHHSGGFEIISAPELFIAAAAERTKRLRLGTGVKSLPYHNPYILAETMAQLDHMTRGRVMFGVGPGALPSDAAMFGMTPAMLRPRMEESWDVVVALLKGETVTKKTDWFALEAARLHIGCYTRPTMELAVTSVRSPAGVLAAGKHGAGVLVLGGIDDAALGHHLHNWHIYEETCAAHGHVADRAKWRFNIQIHIAETREQAKKDLAYGLEKWIGYSHDVVPVPNPVPRNLADPVQYINETQRGIVGTPADAIRDIERMQEKTGGFGVFLIFQHDWANWPASLRSFELIAEEVMPHFAKANRLRQASYDRIAPDQEKNRALARQGVAEAQARFDAAKAGSKAAE